MSLAIALVLAASTAIAGEWVADRFPSKVLGRDYPLTLYLPDAYKDSPGLFPVLYLLHGAGGSETDRVVKGGARLTGSFPGNKGLPTQVRADMN